MESPQHAGRCWLWTFFFFFFKRVLFVFYHHGKQKRLQRRPITSQISASINHVLNLKDEYVRRQNLVVFAVGGRGVNHVWRFKVLQRSILGADLLNVV